MLSYLCFAEPSGIVKFFERLWAALSSNIAICVYVGLLVVVVLIIIISVMRLENISNVQKPDDAFPTSQPIKRHNKSRFYALKEVDKQVSVLHTQPLDSACTLEQICLSFRNFAASRLSLYYSMGDIRKFIAGLATSRIVVMQGMSGTGKTSLAYAFGEYLGNPATIIPIQPMWKERTDLIGYYNELTKRFNETSLLKKMYEANYSEQMYVTVLDEMNIARIEYYFAEFLSLLEIPNPDGRYLDVVSDKWEDDPVQLKDGKIRLPVNMWFIGTANNDDSTFSISDKVYDRAMVMNLDRRSKPFTAPVTDCLRISAVHWNNLVVQAKQDYEITQRSLMRIAQLDNYMIDKFRLTFGNRILRQIKDYVSIYLACGGEELEAIDDILSKKVLRKLESYNPIYVRNAIEGFTDYLNEVFGKGNMPLCLEYLKHLEASV